MFDKRDSVYVNENVETKNGLFPVLHLVDIQSLQVNKF